MTGYKCSTLYTYDALGRQSAVSSGPTSSADLLTSQYAYTLQQWTSSITTSLGGRTVFSETLGYNSPSNSLGGPSYTGLITRKNETWTIPVNSSQSQSVPRTEDYVYDYAARLSAWDDSSSGENISYDARGNITSRSPRYGSGGTVTLTYTGDRLATRKVGTGTAVSFAHDSFARMTTDAEAGLTIAYNVLDLPERISQGTTLKVKYTYLADGTKVSALDASGAGLVYRVPFTYRRSSGGTLTFESAPFDSGRLTEAGTRYHITDHLGSVRAVIDGNASTTTYPLPGFYSVDDFAPFGVKSTSGASSYLSLASTGSTVSLRDGFTGQEDQGPDFGVGYSDFGARQYSPTLSRWLVPDPMGEKYYDVSPYVYCAGNPVNLIDPDGTIIRDKNGKIVYATTGTISAFEHTSGVKALLEIGFIFADNGTPIKVFRNITKDKGWDTNCHGVSFTEGKYWLNNDQVPSLLEGDRYNIVTIEEAKVGDIIIYHGETNTEHSMTIINTNGTMRGTTVYGQGGLEVNNHIDKANEAWSRPDNYLIVRKQYPDRIATENEIQQFINSIPNE